MAERLDGTAALVTGASSGIGQATAIALAAHGVSVAVAARRVDRLDDLAAKIRSTRTRIGDRGRCHRRDPGRARSRDRRGVLAGSTHSSTTPG